LVDQDWLQAGYSESGYLQNHTNTIGIKIIGNITYDFSTFRTKISSIIDAIGTQNANTVLIVLIIVETMLSPTLFTSVSLEE
jgi:hypothetical protein